MRSPGSTVETGVDHHVCAGAEASRLRTPRPFAERPAGADHPTRVARWLEAARGVAGRSHPSFELAALAVLLLLTGAFGRGFSKLELGFSWLHPTEVLLVAILVAAAIRTPWKDWLSVLSRTGVLIPLTLFWLAGAVATARGLAGPGFEQVLHDVGLLEYSVLIVVVALLVRDRSSFAWLCGVVALAGMLGLVALAAGSWTPPEWDVSQRLNLTAAASGMYAALYVAWIMARRAAGQPVAVWQHAVIVAAAGLIFLSSARSAWIGLLVVFACVAAFSLRGRRLALVAEAAVVLTVGTAVATAAEQLRTIEVPDPTTAAEQLLAGGELRHVAVGEEPVQPATANGRTAVGFPAARPDAAGRPGHPDAGVARERRAGMQAADSTPLVVARPDVSDSPASLFSNPGFETGTADGYITFPPNRIIASTDRARAGAYSLQAVYGGDLRLAKTLTYLPLTPGDRYRAAAWVFVPPDWDGGTISLSTDGTWAGARERAGYPARAQGEWARIGLDFTPKPRDTVGGIHVRTDSAPSPGREIYVDNLTVDAVNAPQAEPSDQSADAQAPNPAAAPGGPPSATPSTPDAKAPSGIDKLTASFGSTPQQANARWRLAFWRFTIEEAARQPLWGVGFGTPSNFEWSGIHYDSRTGDPTDPFDVSGPHNSFLNVLYRTGVPGFVALLAILAIALTGLVRLATRTRGEDRALTIWLLASIAATAAAASFSVALEGPFMGIFFWMILGLALLAPRFLGHTPEPRTESAPR